MKLHVLLALASCAVGVQSARKLLRSDSNQGAVEPVAVAKTIKMKDVDFKTPETAKDCTIMLPESKKGTEPITSKCQMCSWMAANMKPGIDVNAAFKESFKGFVAPQWKGLGTAVQAHSVGEDEGKRCHFCAHTYGCCSTSAEVREHFMSKDPAVTPAVCLGSKDQDFGATPEAETSPADPVETAELPDPNFLCTPFAWAPKAGFPKSFGTCEAAPLSTGGSAQTKAEAVSRDQNLYESKAACEEFCLVSDELPKRYCSYTEKKGEGEPELILKSSLEGRCEDKGNKYEKVMTDEIAPGQDDRPTDASKVRMCFCKVMSCTDQKKACASPQTPADEAAFESGENCNCKCKDPTCAAVKVTGQTSAVPKFDKRASFVGPARYWGPDDCKCVCPECPGKTVPVAEAAFKATPPTNCDCACPKCESPEVEVGTGVDCKCAVPPPTECPETDCPASAGLEPFDASAFKSGKDCSCKCREGLCSGLPNKVPKTPANTKVDPKEAAEKCNCICDPAIKCDGENQLKRQAPSCGCMCEAPSGLDARAVKSAGWADGTECKAKCPECPTDVDGVQTVPSNSQSLFDAGAYCGCKCPKPCPSGTHERNANLFYAKDPQQPTDCGCVEDPPPPPIVVEETQLEEVAKSMPPCQPLNTELTAEFLMVSTDKMNSNSCKWYTKYYESDQNKAIPKWNDVEGMVNAIAKKTAKQMKPEEGETCPQFVLKIGGHSCSKLASSTMCYIERDTSGMSAGFDISMARATFMAKQIVQMIKAQDPSLDLPICATLAPLEEAMNRSDRARGRPGFPAVCTDAIKQSGKSRVEVTGWGGTQPVVKEGRVDKVASRRISVETINLGVQ